ncbi:hypothetical protein BDV10DRAFT_166147 [Aspergillus recurvatus]
MRSAMTIAYIRDSAPLDAIMPPIFNALIVGWPYPEDSRDSLASVLQRLLALVIEEWPDMAGEIAAPPADAPPKTKLTTWPLGNTGLMKGVKG